MKNTILFFVAMIICFSGFHFQERDALTVLKPGEEVYHYRGIPTEADLIDKSEEEVKSTWLDVMNAQGNAVNAMERVSALFQKNSEGGISLPDNYGGAYIDDYILFIQLTDTSKESITPYLEALGDLSDAAQFKQVKYSESFLNKRMEELVRVLSAHGIKLSQYCVQIEYNRILLYSAQGDLPQIEEKIREMKLTDMTAVVMMDSSSLPAEPTAVMRGGDYLVRVSGSVPLSLGFCGTYNGQKAIVTCGHAFSSVGQNVKRNGANNAFGVSVYRRYPAPGGTTAGDFAIVNVTNADVITNKVWNTWENESIQNVTGVINSPVNGMALWRFGCITFSGSGYISNYSAPITYDKTYNLTGMIHITNTHTMAQKGDSGGPWVYMNNNKVYLCGIQSGRWLAYGLMFATPYSQFSGQGFIPKLTN